MITRFKARFVVRPEITAVQVEKETDSTVWINGRAHRKITDWETYHDTFEDARNYLVRKKQQEIDAHQSRINSLTEQRILCENATLQEQTP